MAEKTLISNIEENFPLHFYAWDNHFQQLDEELASDKHDKEKLDPRGRTPLLLAVTLGHLESVRVLLKHGCNVNAQNKEGWTVVQEATATGDPDILSIVLENRDLQRSTSRVQGIPALLLKLSEAPDFYVEMTWEFTSWVPLVSRMCPSDTYRVYKSGSNVRIDTTLLGFDQTNWQRGNRSFIFKGRQNGATIMEVDHETSQVYVETLEVSEEDYRSYRPDFSQITQRLTTPIVTTFVDIEKISFERDKAGFWGWRSNRLQEINGYECKVFSASNVEIVAKTRLEHLTESDKKQYENKNNAILSFLTTSSGENKKDEEPFNGIVDIESSTNEVTMEEYFTEDLELKGRDIGRPKEVNTKVNKFKTANLWLSENYPLNLQEQVTPIVDLMAISSSHFAKLKDFIQMQLPSGFPVKIEIPFLHVITARITFGNIFGLDQAIDKVNTVEEEDRVSCVIDDSIFEPHSSYLRLGVSDNVRQQRPYDEDDALLQYAIQQSLMQGNMDCSEDDKVDIYEALQCQQPVGINTNNVSGNNLSPRQASVPYPIDSLEDAQLQRAIEESLRMYPGSSHINIENDSEECDASDADMERALSLSKQQQQEEEVRIKEEEEMLKKILELSMTDK